MSSKLSSSCEPHIPTRDDIQIVRRRLTTHLPLELADKILEDAMYWPKIVTAMLENERVLLSASRGPGVDASRCCLVTPPLPGAGRLEGDWSAITKARMITFRISSHDQGWGGDRGLSGPYDGAWSWFETIILRPTSFNQIGQRGEMLERFLLEYTREKLALPPEGDLQAFGFTYGGSALDGAGGDARWVVQRNARAVRTARDHEITWTRDGASGGAGSGNGAGFVSALRGGDVVAVVARAKYPGWENHVESIQMEIYGSTV
ncbi:hypothetical protein BD779DRAFT_1678024 [Infundibulicybe gibba]|nr:hypothetical protein BD779DRAFT_1678024 [Infundibulicybe gibba]